MQMLSLGSLLEGFVNGVSDTVGPFQIVLIPLLILLPPQNLTRQYMSGPTSPLQLDAALKKPASTLTVDKVELADRAITIHNSILPDSELGRETWIEQTSSALFQSRQWNFQMQ